MATISVDVFMDEFDNDELVRELSYRVKNHHFKGAINTRMLKEALEELNSQLSAYAHDIEIKTLDDTCKMDHFRKVFSKYTSAQIEAALPV